MTDLMYRTGNHIHGLLHSQHLKQLQFSGYFDNGLTASCLPQKCQLFSFTVEVMTATLPGVETDPLEFVELS